MTAIAMIFDLAMTFGLLMAVALVGVPTYGVMAVVTGIKRPSIGLCWLFGFFWISIVSWYGFRAGLKLGDLYRGLFIFSASLAGSGFVVLGRYGALPSRREASSALREVCADLAGFGACAVCYVAPVVSALRSTDLQWPTILNADVFVYVKSATYLSLFPTANPAVGATRLSPFIESDVFGSFNLIALAKFVFKNEVSHVVVPAMALGVGLVGMAVARSCRVVFHAGTVLSILLGMVTVTGLLFQYIALNYFLSQILFIAMLTTTVLWAVEGACGKWQLTGYGAVMWATAGCVLLSYDVWALQFVAVFTSVVAVVRSSGTGLSTGDRVRAALVSCTVMAPAGLMGMGLASASRTAGVLAKLTSLSVPNIAGWPLPFVDPDLLLGLPSDWQIGPVPRPAVYGPLLAFVVLLAVVGLSVARLDRAPGRVARLITLSVFFAGVLAYAVVWIKFGETYQQWKFASTLPLGFGFTVLATIIALSRGGASRQTRLVSAIAAAAFLILCLGLNVSLTHEKWLPTIAHLPSTLESLATIDRAPGDTPVYVDIADFQVRMAALAFINLKPLTFAGISQFGPGTSPPTAVAYTEVKAACELSGELPPTYEAAITQPGKYPLVSLNQIIPLSHDVSSCISMSGFAAPEPWGRRSVDHHASFHLRCDCDLASSDVSLVLEAASPILPDLPAPQQAIFRVNGSTPQTFDLNANHFSNLVVPVPPPPNGGSSIDIEIELPDAAPRPDATDSANPPLYALSAKSIELRGRTR